MPQKKYALLLGFLLCFGKLPLTFAAPTVTAPTVDCFEARGGGFWYDYCVHKVSTSINTDVLYYLHGIDGSQYEWEDSPLYPQVYALWGNEAPTVVSISYGSIWLLADQNGSKWSGLYENFINTALPGIEKAQSLTPRHRLLLGLSMGGFNAAELYLKNPELFYEVALACPAITSVGPWDGKAEIDAYIQRTHATASDVDNAIAISQRYFPNQTAWLAAAPLTLVNHVNSTYPPLFVSGGLQDQYGFFEGSAEFVDAVNAHGAKATWDPVQGPHCTFDWEATALFFLD